MILEESTILIATHLETMNSLYGKVVFDEWAVVFLASGQGRLLHYIGPRREHFLQNFGADSKPLRRENQGVEPHFGDFAFAEQGGGTSFDAVMVLGEGLYLLCNNTSKTVRAITKDPLWISAQIPFVGLSDKVRSNPLVHPL